MAIRLLVAAADNDVIGRGSELPWRLPGDLRRFAALTRGNAVVMGRVTYESILARLGKPLPGRHSIVLTRGGDIAAAPDVEVASCAPEAMAKAQAYTIDHGRQDWFVIGGAAVYRELLEHVDVVDLTRVHAQVPGDVVMPTGWLDGFQECAVEPAEDPDADHAYSFVTLRRSCRAGSVRA